jgi:hypothetical protein
MMHRRTDVRIWVAAALVLGAGCAPQPQPVPQAAVPVAPVAAIDSVTLMRDLGVLAHDSMEGRLVGSPGGERARRFLLERYAEIDMEPVVPGFGQPFTFELRGEQITGVNLLGMVRGTALPERFIVITAHYDHLGIRNGDIYVGADDNASGTAALLALADYFRRNPPRHSIIFAALDGEEGGLRGARYFVANPPVPLESVILNVNMDMVGRNDQNELYVAGTHHYPQLLPFVQQVAASAEVRLIPGHDTPNPARPSDDWTMASDHGAFHEAGIPFLYFGVEDHPDYHRPTDRVEGIMPGFFNRAARTVLSAVRLLDAELEGARPPAR